MVNDKVVSNSPTDSRHVSRFFGRYLIKERFQFKFAFIVFLFLGIATMTIWWFGNYSVQQLIDNESIKDAIAIEQLHNVNSLIFKIGIIYMVVAIFLSLLFSHLVAGPIYRFEKTLEEIRAGNLTMFIKLRKRDEFKETAEIFNQAIVSLRNKVQKERDGVSIAADKVKALADRLKAEGKTSEAAELEQIVFDFRNVPPQIKI
jgi:methyl-accepting chemotaxis protein